jgi:hypothetical protein
MQHAQQLATVTRGTFKAKREQNFTYRLKPAKQYVHKELKINADPQETPLLYGSTPCMA